MICFLIFLMELHTAFYLSSFLISAFSATSFPLSIVLAVSHSFICCNWAKCPFKFSLETSSLTHGSFRSVLFSFPVFGGFPVSFLLLISNLILLWSENVLFMILITLNLLRLISWPKIWSFWRMFCDPLKRICILLLVGGVF